MRQRHAGPGTERRGRWWAGGVGLAGALAVAACSPGATSQPSPGAATCSPSGADLANAFDRAEGAMLRWTEEAAIPGAAAAVVCGDSAVWAHGLGVWAMDDSTSVTADTPFRVASLTKVFTAVAILHLADAGELALDDPVRDHVPTFPGAPGDEPVTVMHLLTHTSGLPANSRVTDFGALYQPPRDVALNVLPEEELLSVPGAEYRYSNFGYGVLGEVVRQVSGRSYEAYVDQEILGPLGMTETLVHPTRSDRTAWGHGPLQPDGTRPKAGFWDLGFMTPAGGMAASVVQVSRFLVDQLRPYAGESPPTVLEGETVRAMHRVHHLLDPERGGAGLGWAVETSGGQHVVYHGGELPEQTSFFLIDVEALIGVVVVANAQDAGAQAMAWEILETVRGAAGAS